VASNYTDNFNSTNFGADGLMGMGFKEISPFKAAPFFETLVDQGQLEEPVFGFYLAELDSALMIGGRDSSRYSGDLTYVSVDKKVRILRDVPCLRFNTDMIQGFWQTTFDAISVNGNDIPVSIKDAIIDTGSTLISGDQESISNIYSKIPGSAQAPDGNLWSSTLITMMAVRVAN
jgi:cathepsin D